MKALASILLVFNSVAKVPKTSNKSGMCWLQREHHAVVFSDPNFEPQLRLLEKTSEMTFSQSEI